MINDIATLWRFFPDAVVAGVVIAAVCAVLGVFVILKRVVFIGIALSEVAACGIAAAMIAGVHPFVGAGLLTLAAVAILAYPFEVNRIPRDAILGIVFVLASSLSILLVSQSGFGLHEVRALLYGDLILTNRQDLTIILMALVPVLAAVLVFLRPMLHTFMDRDGAKVLGIRVVLWELLFFFALGLAVSAASKVAGALLVFCYLVVAPSAALLLSRRLGVVLGLAVLLAVASTLGGLAWAVSRDLPANQTIAVAACGLLGLALAWRGVRRLLARGRSESSATCNSS
jgi:ABC-type Mn2+/Zn2+ transport system permease subunit